MNIASVIVDVPAKQTDKAFDYLIPDKWLDIIQPGIRVIVPFGPRKIQGFVIGTKAQSDFAKLKEIVEPIDLVPVLNKELLELGHWLTETTLSFKIVTFQAMLPAALKAKYEKKVSLAPGVKAAELPEELQPFFINNTALTWDIALKSNLERTLHKEAAKGRLEVIYEVKERLHKKKLKFVLPLLPVPELTSELSQLPARAEKQRELVSYFIANPSPIELRKLNELGFGSSSVRALASKGLLEEKDMEVYRDPYEHREFKRTSPLPLTASQTAAIEPILDTIENNLHKVFLLYGVTGSGKTEIYLQSIQEVISKGKEAIVLVPEIALTPQMVNRFKGRFGDLVAVMHSGLSAGEKYDEWRKIQRKEVKVVVGAQVGYFCTV